MSDSDPLREGAVRVARKLRSAGFEAWFAGGCVRDHLLGRPPKDWDIATDARPEEVQAQFRRTVAVGAAFGVIQVLDGRDRSYEVATYRADGEYVDGRRPSEVHYSSSRIEDVKRRDFTINALLMDPESGVIEDHVGGRADLEARTIRAVGVPLERFREDRLRMLRALRFAARLDFAIEAETWRAIAEESLHLGVVSPERITQELEGILLCAHPGRGLRLVDEAGLANVCLPDPRPADLEAQLARLPNEGRGLSAEARGAVAWSLLHGAVPPDSVESSLRSRRVSRALIRDVKALLEGARVASASTSLGGPMLRLAREARADRLMVYLACAYGPDAPQTHRLRAAQQRLQEHPPVEQAILSGADLKSLGLAPGPGFKRILTEVEDAALEGRLSSRAEALAFAQAAAGRAD